MNEQRAQIAVATLADTQEHIATTAGMLTRDQAEPGAEFTPVFEFVRVAYGGDQRGRDQRSNPFNLGQTRTALVLAKPALHP